MSIIGKIFDIFGTERNSFYARDFRNAYTFRPDQNPPRQKFQGYVNFVINRSLYASTQYGNDNSAFRLQVGSLVRTASLPEVEFKTETKNEYNRKRIVNTGVEYQPVDIKVFDTINNEWLTMFMKYFSYHYLNPRSKQYNDSDNRDVGENPTEAFRANDFAGTKFGFGDKWDSNQYGYNLNLVSNFFERIDYVLYHGNKGVQYSLINPVLTRFRTGEIDYSSSEVMEFDMTFEYEAFTIHETVNFGLSEFDIARFEQASGFTGPAFVPFNPPIALEENRLGILSKDYKRTAQPQNTLISTSGTEQTDPGEVPGVTVSDRDQTDPGFVPPPIDSELAGSPEFQAQTDAATEQQSSTEANARRETANASSALQGNPLPSVYGNKAEFATATQKDKSFIGGLLGQVADQALTAAIHGKSVKNAVVNTVVGGVIQGVTDVIRTPVRPPKAQPNETPSGSQESAPVTPNTGG